MCSLLLSYNDLRRRWKPIGGEHAVCLVHYSRRRVGGAVYNKTENKFKEKGFQWDCHKRSFVIYACVHIFKIMFNRK